MMDEKHLTLLGEIGGLAQRHSSRTSVKLESRIVVEHGSVGGVDQWNSRHSIDKMVESVKWSP
jgi:hypothetical protein